MAEEEQRRRFTRVALPYPISATSAEVEISEPVARDISARGVYITTTTQLPLDTGCRVRIHVKEWVVIEVQGRVVRCETEGVALEFTKISLPDFEHLLRIIRTNAEDPDTVLHEFEDHLGQLIH